MTSTRLDFSMKIAVVTGGAMGIGADIAAYLLRGGATVVIADLDNRGAATVEAWKKEGLDASFVPCNVKSYEDVERLASFVEQHYGRVDILVNNAGVFPRGRLLEMSEELWHHVLDVNLKGTMLTCKALAPVMIRSGGGSIVNIGSLHHQKGQEDTLAYAVSKGGLMTLSRNLAGSLAKHKIRVNVVHPGWVLSEGERARIEQTEKQEDIDRIIGMLPLGGMQTGTDIAHAVAFFCSDLASQITGQMIAVDGGMSVIF